MITIGTKLVILEISLSCLLFFCTFISIYNLHLLSKIKIRFVLPILYLLLLSMNLFLNTYSNILFIIIMYLSLNKRGQKNYYLLNSIIFSLLTEFISSAISSVIVSQVFKNNDVLWVTFLIIIESILLFSIIFLLKKLGIIKFIGHSKSLPLSIVLFYNYLVIFIFMFFIRTFKAYITLGTGILIFLLIQSIAITFIFIYEQKKQKDMLEKSLMKEQLDNLKEYTAQLDHDQKEMHKFKHDYKNILNSLTEIASLNNNDNLRKSINQLDVYSKNYFDNISMDDFKNLEYISNPYIKSLLISKLKTMKTNNIDCYFECRNDISTVNINIFDLIRLLGVAIDNAIETGKNQKNAKVKIIIINMDNQLEITIKNTIINAIPIEKITELGFSTKKNHAGIGMVNIQDIKKKYKNLLVNYNVKDDWFSLQIVITN